MFEVHFAAKDILDDPLTDRQKVKTLTLIHRTVKKCTDLTGLNNCLIFMGAIKPK